MLKPLLSALILPPLGPLLLALLGLWMMVRRKRGGLVLALLSLALLWLLSCHGTAIGLSRHLLESFPPVTADQLKAEKVQAIVVLGGGVLPQAPEYGEAQPRAETAARLRYGLWLARQTGLPVAFTGGLGRASHASQTETEAEVARRVAAQDYGMTLRWLESESRDTAENARMLAPVLQRDGITRVAVVTHAWHMSRAVAEFAATGLAVTPAPMGFILPNENVLLQWLPSGEGLLASRQVLREWLGLTVNRLTTALP